MAVDLLWFTQRAGIETVAQGYVGIVAAASRGRADFAVSPARLPTAPTNPRPAAHVSGHAASVAAVAIHPNVGVKPT
jgi:hypothetical protein